MSTRKKDVVDDIPPPKRKKTTRNAMLFGKHNVSTMF